MAPSRSSDPATAPRQQARAASAELPVMSQAQLEAFLIAHPAVYHLEIRHQHKCPAAGTGRGCVCAPDHFLRAADWTLIAEVR